MQCVSAFNGEIPIVQQPIQTTLAENTLMDNRSGGIREGNDTQKHASLPHGSRATAFRELDQLSEHGVLPRVGQGRALRQAKAK